MGEPLAQARHSIAVRKDRPELRALLDDALAEFLVSPEFRTLHAKWYAGPPSFWTPTLRTWVAGACSVLLMLGLLAWQLLSLRAESRQRAESAPGKLPRERTAAAYPTRVISRNCGLVALALGFAVLWGWAFDVAMFRTMLPGLVAMQPWTAITIALSAPVGFCRFLRQTWDRP